MTPYAVRPDEQTVARARARIARVGGQHPLATTQAHHRMEGFDFVREVTADHPHTPPPKDTADLLSRLEQHQAKSVADHAWGMVIDLDLCIGCNACVSACNVENNVLVVGKDQVARGREMHWLRVDRYYTGDAENPRSYLPAGALHALREGAVRDGLPGARHGALARKASTRWSTTAASARGPARATVPTRCGASTGTTIARSPNAEQAAQNPDVTVRSRGVMEKCTYCTQRIEAAHVAADKENRAAARRTKS